MMTSALPTSSPSGTLQAGHWVWPGWHPLQVCPIRLKEEEEEEAREKGGETGGQRCSCMYLQSWEWYCVFVE